MSKQEKEYICDVCNAKFETCSQLGGHRSGHTRRKEAVSINKFKQNARGKCLACNKQFETSHKLAGHRRLMHASFESFKTDKRRKNYLLVERSLKCEICNLSEWMGKVIPIELDHIDGNSENNIKENLRLICPNCHAQTETYKGKNVGKIFNSERQLSIQRRYEKYRLSYNCARE